jgi:hypothetical protein
MFASAAVIGVRTCCRHVDRCRQQPFPELRTSEPRVTVCASKASAPGPTSGDSKPDNPQSVPHQEPLSGGVIQVLPRLKERDPFKVLGIPSDSDFEEVIQARNYLVQVLF